LTEDEGRKTEAFRRWSSVIGLFENLPLDFAIAWFFSFDQFQVLYT
jgi:hypothetical protein